MFLHLWSFLHRLRNTWLGLRLLMPYSSRPSVTASVPDLTSSPHIPLRLSRSDGWKVEIDALPDTFSAYGIDRNRWMHLLTLTASSSDSVPSFPRYLVRLRHPKPPHPPTMALVPHPSFGITWGLSIPSAGAIVLSSGIPDSMRVKIWKPLIDRRLGTIEDSGIPADHFQRIEPPIVVCYQQGWAIITAVTRTWRYHESLPYDEIVEPVVLLRAQTWPMLLERFREWLDSVFDV